MEVLVVLGVSGVFWQHLLTCSVCVQLQEQAVPGEAPQHQCDNPIPQRRLVLPAEDSAQRPEPLPARAGGRDRAGG